MIKLEQRTIDIDLVPVFAFWPENLEFYVDIWNNIDTTNCGKYYVLLINTVFIKYKLFKKYTFAL